VGKERFGRGQALGVRSGQIDDHADDGLRSELAAANAEPANFDQAGHSGRWADHKLPRAGVKMDTIIADQHGGGYLPRAPGKDEIERQSRFAGT
jgi:hypothetical protein